MREDFRPWGKGTPEERGKGDGRWHFRKMEEQASMGYI